MARENLRYAAQTVEALRATTPEVYNALVHKTALEPSEVEAWTRAAESMYVPHDEKLRIIPQDDNFLDREPWDFQNTPRDHYPLLLFYHPLNIYRKQVIKQADVVLAMFLLGDAFSPEAKQRNFEFYDPLTTGDSSLSSCVEAIIAAQIGDMDKAIRYGMAALLMDLADVGGNVKDGCHIASMGGTWMMLTYGFGGMRDDDGTLSFWPRRAPEDNAILRFCGWWNEGLKNNGDGSPDSSILCGEQSSTGGGTGEPSMGNKHICLPFASEAQYREYVDDPAQYRQYLSEMLSQYPELFPQDMDQGFHLSRRLRVGQTRPDHAPDQIAHNRGPSSPCAPRSSCPP